MKNILPAIATVLIVGLSAWYFTTVAPQSADALQPELKVGYEMDRDDNQDAVIFSLIMRIKELETRLQVKVPEEFEISINKKK